MKLVLNVFVGAVIALLAHATHGAPAQAGQKALLIGVGTYPHLSSDEQLPGARSDARKMREFLKTQWGMAESDILLLLDTDATKAAITEALFDWLPGVSRPGDRIIIYFSGHGSQIRDTSGDEADGMDEVFMPSDSGGGVHSVNLLIDDEIRDAFASLLDREILLIADSCNSGTLSRSVDFDATLEQTTHRERYIRPDFDPDYRLEYRDEEPVSREVGAHLTLSAAMPHQWAWESSGTGVFTAYLLEALTDLRADFNENGIVTSAEVINYIRPKTEAYCEKVQRCRHVGFTPNMDPKNGTFVLATRNEEREPDFVDDVTDVLPEVNGHTITLSINPGNVHRIGDLVSFTVTSAADGYLTLLDITASGELVPLFPKPEDIERGKLGRIRANSPLQIPDKSYGFKFYAQPPTGKGQLLALVTHDRINLSDPLSNSSGLEPIANPLAFVQSVSERLHAVYTGERDNRGASWAIGYAGYEVRD